MNAEIENIRDKKLSEFGTIGDEEERARFGTKLEAEEQAVSAEPAIEPTPPTSHEIAPEPVTEPVEEAITEPVVEATPTPIEVAEPQASEETKSVKDDPYEEGVFAGAPAIAQQNSSKKKLFMLIIVIIAFFAGGYFTFINGEDEAEQVVELDDLPALPTPPAPDYIDNGESHNQFMQKNAAAKENNVSIFNFDINQCLQRFSDVQCMKMYEDSLKIEENRNTASIN